MEITSLVLGAEFPMWLPWLCNYAVFLHAELWWDGSRGGTLEGRVDTSTPGRESFEHKVSTSDLSPQGVVLDCR